jgi:hypothetical protein
VAAETAPSPPPSEEEPQLQIASRRTRGGECKYKIWTGNDFVVCPCKASVFSIPENVSGFMSIRCNNCAHLIGSHGDFLEDTRPSNDMHNMNSVEKLENAEELSVSTAAKVSELTSHPYFILRQETVGTLWNELQQVRAIQVRGPPKSGKSALAALLAWWVSEASGSNTAVVSITCPDPSGLTVHSNHLTLLREIGVAESFLSSQSPRLLVIDAAQNLHRPEFHSFWNEFVNCRATSGELPELLVALFSSYGDPRSGHPELQNGHEPTALTPRQRVSIKNCLPSNNPNVSLYFSKEELDEVVGKFCHDGRNKALNFSSATMEFLWSFTGGHPGCTRAILHAVKEANVSSLASI